MTHVLRSMLCGAAAGAAGTSALNAVTYLDMALRGRPASSTPEDTVEKLSEQTGIPVPGEGDTRRNRLTGLGALTGIAAGVGAGALLGVLRGSGWRHGTGLTSLVAGAVAMLAGNGPMTVLGTTDPRTWGASGWAADLVPHAAYGMVTGAVLVALDDAPGR